MNVTDPGEEQTASVPTSGDAGRQGRQASPPNPTKGENENGSKLTEKMDLRCTAAEKEALKRQAAVAGVSPSQLLREALGLVEVRRRKPFPAVAPEVVHAVGQVTRDLQDLAREGCRASGGKPDCLALLVMLVAVDRRLADLLSHDFGGG